MDISLRSLEEAVGIRRQIENLEKRLSSIFGNSGTAGAATPRRRGKISAAGRARIRAAQRARWAKARGDDAKAPAARRATRKRKNHLSAAGRAKISRIMKARWAARRKAQGKKR